MEELYEIAEAVVEADPSDRPPVLATLVRVLGSGFRAPGARMLVLGDGRCIGDLSGGCLDGDVVARARSLEGPELVVYDGNEIANLSSGFGVGCPHRVEVLVQPLRSPDEFPAAPLLELRRLRGRALLGVVCATDGEAELALGQHLLLGEDEPAATSAAELRAYWEQTRPASFVRVPSGAGEARFFLENIAPSRRLLLLGGTTLVEPVVRFARILGWDVVAFQSRDDRNPPADGLEVAHIDPARLTQEIALDAQTWVVIMEHDQKRDRAWLDQVLPSGAPYVGLLGSRKRVARMFDELESSERGLPSIDRQRLHGPVGLDLGASTPAEIALAIVAEVQGVASNASLRPKRESLERQTSQESDG